MNGFTVENLVVGKPNHVKLVDHYEFGMVLPSEIEYGDKDQAT